MNQLTMPASRSVQNARRNAEYIAQRIADSPQVIYSGEGSAENWACTMCGRMPRTGRLFEVVIDVPNDAGVRVGIGVCQTYLSEALNAELHALDPSDPANSVRIKRIGDALGAIVS